jgi:hypothetical protein
MLLCLRIIACCRNYLTTDTNSSLAEAALQCPVPPSKIPNIRQAAMNPSNKVVLAFFCLQCLAAGLLAVTAAAGDVHGDTTADVATISSSTWRRPSYQFFRGSTAVTKTLAIRATATSNDGTLVTTSIFSDGDVTLSMDCSSEQLYVYISTATDTPTTWQCIGDYFDDGLVDPLPPTEKCFTDAYLEEASEGWSDDWHYTSVYAADGRALQVNNVLVQRSTNDAGQIVCRATGIMFYTGPASATAPLPLSWAQLFSKKWRLTGARRVKQGAR